VVQTTVDKLSDLRVLHMLECLGFNALGDLSVDLRLVGAFGVRIILGNLSMSRMHNKEHASKNTKSNK